MQPRAKGGREPLRAGNRFAPRASSRTQPGQHSDFNPLRSIWALASRTTSNERVVLSHTVCGFCYSRAGRHTCSLWPDPYQKPWQSIRKIKDELAQAFLYPRPPGYWKEKEAGLPSLES